MTPGDIADDKKAVAWSFLLPDTPSKSIRNRTKADESEYFPLCACMRPEPDLLDKRVKKPKVELDEQDEVDREMARLLPSDDEAGMYSSKYLWYADMIFRSVN